MFENVTTEQVMDLATKVGRSVARDYPGVDAEDIASEALTRLMTDGIKESDPTPDYVFAVLNRHGRAYAAKERYDFIIGTAQYVYTPREIRALMETCYFDPNAWTAPTGKEDYLSAEIGGNSIVCSLIDIKTAMGNIKPAYKRVIERRFYEGDDSMHRKDVTRAIDALTRSVNRIVSRHGYAAEGLGSREVMSNDRAVNVTRSTLYDDTRDYQEDALDVLQRERSYERSHPPGTFYNWTKYADE